MRVSHVQIIKLKLAEEVVYAYSIDTLRRVVKNRTETQISGMEVSFRDVITAFHAKVDSECDRILNDQDANIPASLKQLLHTLMCNELDGAHVKPGIGQTHSLFNSDVPHSGMRAPMTSLAEYKNLTRLLQWSSAFLIDDVRKDMRCILTQAFLENFISLRSELKVLRASYVIFKSRYTTNPLNITDLHSDISLHNIDRLEDIPDVDPKKKDHTHVLFVSPRMKLADLVEWVSPHTPVLALTGQTRSLFDVMSDLHGQDHRYIHIALLQPDTERAMIKSDKEDGFVRDGVVDALQSQEVSYDQFSDRVTAEYTKAEDKVYTLLRNYAIPTGSDQVVTEA